MKKNLAVTVLIFVLVSIFLGCGTSAPISSNEVPVVETPKVVPSPTPIVEVPLDNAVAESVKGIPECDETLKLIAAEANRKEDNEPSNLSKTAFLNKIKESIKKSVGDNKGDKAETAKNCKAFKAQIERYKKLDEDKK